MAWSALVELLMDAAIGLGMSIAGKEAEPGDGSRVLLRDTPPPNRVPARPPGQSRLRVVEEGDTLIVETPPAGLTKRHLLWLLVPWATLAGLFYATTLPPAHPRIGALLGVAALLGALTAVVVHDALAACGEIGGKDRMTPSPRTNQADVLQYTALGRHAQRPLGSPQAARCLLGGTTPQPPREQPAAIRRTLLRRRHRLSISRDGLSVRVLRGLVERHFAFPATELVDLTPVERANRPITLRIRGRTALEVGRGLTLDELHWIRDAVHAKVCARQE